MKWAMCILALAGAILAADDSAKATAKDLELAQRVAKAFLTHIDAGNERSAASFSFEWESYDAKSGRTRKHAALNANTLKRHMERVKEFGQTKDRTLDETTLKETLSSATPRGRYVCFVYSLRLRDKTVRELLTIKVDSPQSGKVVQYSIYP